MSDLDPLDIDAQEKAASDRKDRIDHTERLQVEDFKWLMSDKRGRRFIYGLLDKAGVYRTSFDPNEIVLAFKEGQRNIGLVYTTMINDNCPERYNQMIEERNENDRRNTDTNASTNAK